MSKKYLEVVVKDASDLIKADIIGKSDPYVKMGISKVMKKKKKINVKLVDKKKQVKTKIKKNTLNPRWDQKFMLEVNDIDTEFLDISVWDWDRKDDLIGEMLPLPLSRLPKEYPLQWEFPLKPKGILRLRITAIGFGTNAKEYKISIKETHDIMKGLMKD